MTIFTTGDGNTPLSPDEQADLIPNLATKEELNEFERANILVAYDWALTPRNLRRQDPMTEPYIRDLHRRMFDQTWKWAGIYRTTEKNIGIAPDRIHEALGILLGDTRYWLEHKTFPPDETAGRFHHRLVFIHPFANGNLLRRPAPEAIVAEGGAVGAGNAGQLITAVPRIVVAIHVDCHIPVRVVGRRNARPAGQQVRRIIWPASTNLTASSRNSSVYCVRFAFPASRPFRQLEQLAMEYFFRGQGQCQSPRRFRLAHRDQHEPKFILAYRF